MVRAQASPLYQQGDNQMANKLSKFIILKNKNTGDVFYTTNFSDIKETEAITIKGYADTLEEAEYMCYGIRCESLDPTKIKRYPANG